MKMNGKMESGLRGLTVEHVDQTFSIRAGVIDGASLELDVKAVFGIAPNLINKIPGEEALYWAVNEALVQAITEAFGGLNDER